jgi:hypothetical protein
MKIRDNRKVLKNQKIEANGAQAFFDGKYDPIENQLKVYRYRGDINIADEALQNYAIVKGIAKVVILN